MSSNLHTILIVEDNDEDFYAIQRGLRNSGVANNLIRCVDGEDAMEFLRHDGRYSKSSAIVPNIVLLDLNLPKVDGKSILKFIKQTPHLSTIPVVVLTTSTDPEDIRKVYEMGGNSYIQKPVDLTSFIEAIQKIKNYWFEIVVFPKD